MYPYNKPTPTYKVIVALIKDDKLFCYKQNKLGAFKLPYKETQSSKVDYTDMAEDILKELGVTARYSTGCYFSNDKTEVMVYSYAKGKLDGEYKTKWLELEDINRSNLVLEPEEVLEEIKKLLKKQNYKIIEERFDLRINRERVAWETRCSEVVARTKFLEYIHDWQELNLVGQLRLYDESGNKIWE